VKIAIILGTRPEIIKMSPIIRALEYSKMEFFILHTGQHYSYNMDQVFFEQLKLPQPKYNLGVGSGTHAEETGKMMIGKKILLDEKPDIVLVEGKVPKHLRKKTLSIENMDGFKVIRTFVLSLPARGLPIG